MTKIPDLVMMVPKNEPDDLHPKFIYTKLEDKLYVIDMSEIQKIQSPLFHSGLKK